MVIPARGGGRGRWFLAWHLDTDCKALASCDRRHCCALNSIRAPTLLAHRCCAAWLRVEHNLRARRVELYSRQRVEKVRARALAGSFCIGVPLAFGVRALSYSFGPFCLDTARGRHDLLYAWRSDLFRFNDVFHYPMMSVSPDGQTPHTSIAAWRPAPPAPSSAGPFGMLAVSAADGEALDTCGAAVSDIGPDVVWAVRSDVCTVAEAPQIPPAAATDGAAACRQNVDGASGCDGYLLPGCGLGAGHVVKLCT